MFAIPSHRQRPIFDTPEQIDAVETARRSNRRRLNVFLIVFLLTLLPGLAWNLLRPAEYRATARVQITPGAVSFGVAPAPSGPAANTSEQPVQRSDLLSQLQVLNSRSLLEVVLLRLERDEHVAAFSGADRVAELQNAISVSPVAGTDVVELQAIGRSPQLMAKILNTLIDTYREQLLSSHGSASEDALVNLKGEVERLGVSIAEKRAQLAAFRVRSGVVSSERSENEALARIKGLSESVNKANEEAAKAEARLRALREAAATGKRSVYAKDNPTLASIEQRISAIREELRDMERSYTPSFMAMDPTARALRARQAELEQQLSESRSASQQGMLSAAEEEAAGAHATVERLRGQIEAQRREAQTFSGNFHEAQALEDDLARLEGARRNASERLARLEASERGRLPTLKLIEAAGVPQTPWHPDYLRDGLLNLLASFLLGLLSMWFVELFNRSASPPPAAPTTVFVPQPWMAPALAMDRSLSSAELAIDMAPQAVPLLSAAACLPRELTQGEVAALLVGADSEPRLLCSILLLGLRSDELSALLVRDIDLATLQLTVRGASARTLTLPEWLAVPLAKYAGDDPEKPLFRNSLGQPLGESEIDSRLTCAALDAGLDEAQSVSPAVLRHTCIAHLVRQNVRFSDLASLVGQLSAEALSAYAALASGPRHLRGTEVDLVMPALRGIGVS